MKKIAIFASGSGTNFQAIINAVHKGELQADIQLLVCDKPDAFCIKRAVKGKIPQFIFSAKEYPNKEAYEKVILNKLEDLNVEYIILAGYMRLIGQTLLRAFEGKIINIHPSLLPAFPGKDAIGQAFEAKAEVSGVTVHFVDEGMDTGPIIAQQEVEISSEETMESLEAKIHRIEHQLYPAVLQKLLTNNL
ncbi:phosphoribosylglycinamide formyltransferase [Bacillus sp. FJAT-29937]|uniref:phosphoribosylglycinamide formyltransferase n=1 Tax=Bacillus sp. FJAT-29937 TaxID=1720553 RepID=UPI00082ADBA1|nr:phosphoribosylglycinamide formyltransferase [Bacillus sp. FJAT-29937]